MGGRRGESIGREARELEAIRGAELLARVATAALVDQGEQYPFRVIDRIIDTSWNFSSGPGIKEVPGPENIVGERLQSRLNVRKAFRDSIANASSIKDCELWLSVVCDDERFWPPLMGGIALRNTRVPSRTVSHLENLGQQEGITDSIINLFVQRLDSIPKTDKHRTVFKQGFLNTFAGQVSGNRANYWLHTDAKYYEEGGGSLDAAQTMALRILRRAPPEREAWESYDDAPSVALSLSQSITPDNAGIFWSMARLFSELPIRSVRHTRSKLVTQSCDLTSRLLIHLAAHGNKNARLLQRGIEQRRIPRPTATQQIQYFQVGGTKPHNMLPHELYTQQATEPKLMEGLQRLVGPVAPLKKLNPRSFADLLTATERILLVATIDTPENGSLAATELATLTNDVKLCILSCLQYVVDAQPRKNQARMEKGDVKIRNELYRRCGVQEMRSESENVPSMHLIRAALAAAAQRRKR